VVFETPSEHLHLKVSIGNWVGQSSLVVVGAGTARTAGKARRVIKNPFMMTSRW